MLHWTELLVTGEDGIPWSLEAMMLNMDQSLRRIKLAEDGSIAEWPQLFVHAPLENPDWDTPKKPIDWTGFAEEIRRIQAEFSDE